MIVVKTKLDIAAEAVRSINLSVENACMAFDLDENEALALKALFAESMIVTNKFKEEIKKKSLFRRVGDVCGLDKNLAEIISFLNGDLKKLSVVGPPNSGKTILLDEALSISGLYNERVYDIDHFFKNRIYAAGTLFPIVHVIDASGNEDALIKTKGFKNFKKTQAFNKIIVVSRGIDPRWFDEVITMEPPDFDTVLAFLRDKRPSLLDGTSDEHLKRTFDLVNGSFYGFVSALESIETGSCFLNGKATDLAIHLVKLIYTEKDRETVLSTLDKHVKLLFTDKKETGSPIIHYIGFLEDYLVENVGNYYHPGDPEFFTAIKVLGMINAARFVLGSEGVVSMLAYAMPPSGRETRPVLPEVHSKTMYIERKARARQ